MRIPLEILPLLLLLHVGASTEDQPGKFIRYIFNKYGSRGEMSFEGLEHLMFNLGLGNIEFSVNHSILEHRPLGYREPEGGFEEDRRAVWHEILFLELHDKQHRHAKRHNSKKKCLSPLSIVHLILEENSTKLVEEQNEPIYRKTRHVEMDEAEEVEELEEANLEEVNDLKITPSLFKELCPALLVQLDSRECEELPNHHRPLNYTIYQAWIFASISVFIISACGLIGIAVVPLANSNSYNNFLNFLVALAIGTLLGDALMHLLPHAMVPHGGGHSHESNHSSDSTLLTFAAFLAALFMYSLENLLPLLGAGGHTHSPHTPRSDATEDGQMIDSKVQKSRLSPVALMVVIGDGLHNVTDGLAIGAAFVIDPVTGFSTAIAICLHELPHELGDFALLIKSGVPLRRAVSLNVVSSVLSFIGMAVGLAVSTESTAKWIYAATAGSFLYIALADLVPELQKVERTFKANFCNILGVGLGGLVMLAIANYEDSISQLFEA